MASFCLTAHEDEDIRPKQASSATECFMGLCKRLAATPGVQTPVMAKPNANI